MKRPSLVLIYACSFLILQGCLPSSPDQVQDKAHWVRVMSETTEQQNPDIKALSYPDWKYREEQGEAFVLIDVREPAERDVSTLADAVTLEQWRAQHPGPTDVTPLFYCTNGKRSLEQARRAKQAGHQQATYIKGGLLDLAHRQVEFVHQGAPTKTVHGLSEAWNFFPESYHVVFP